MHQTHLSGFTRSVRSNPKLELKHKTDFYDFFTKKNRSPLQTKQVIYNQIQVISYGRIHNIYTNTRLIQKHTSNDL